MVSHTTPWVARRTETSFARKTCPGLAQLVQSGSFETVAGFLIISNAIFIGIEATSA